MAGTVLVKKGEVLDRRESTAPATGVRRKKRTKLKKSPRKSTRLGIKTAQRGGCGKGTRPVGN